MGSLAVAGAIGGLGKGMVDNATESRAQADKEAERRHAMQLERQRNRFQIERDTTRSTHEIGMADVQYGRDVSLTDKGFQHQLAGKNVDSYNQTERDAALHEDALELQKLKNKGVLDASGHAGASARDKWTTYREPAGFEDGKAVYEYIAERNGIQYKQQGDKYIEVGQPADTPEPETFGGNAALQRKAEGDLMNGEMTLDEFKDSFFYVPRKYIDRETVTGTSGKETSSTSAVTPLSGEVEDVFAQAGTLYPNVTTPMLKAVGFIESGFDPMSTSDKGAEGMMQFMPDTAAEYGLTDSFDPGQAIPAAAAYLNDSLQKFGGDEMKAIASYNAGRKRVQDAIDESEKQWVSKLPKETIEYLAKYAAAKSEYEQGGNLVEEGAAGPLATAAAAETAVSPAPAPAPAAFNGPYALPEQGALGTAASAMGSGFVDAGQGMAGGLKSAGGAISEGARKAKEALFGTSE